MLDSREVIRRRAAERAAFIMEQAEMQIDAFDSMSVPATPTAAQLEREAARAWARKRDAEIWKTVTLPRIIAEADLARGNHVAHE